MRALKILFVGDAVVSTGFSTCTHAACDALHAAGHDVHILGLNYFGDPHDYPYRIYPCHSPLDGGTDGFGNTRLPVLVRRLRPDVIVILQDPWNIPGYLAHLSAAGIGNGPGFSLPLPPLVAWLAVDAKNQHTVGLNELTHVVAWTQFGVDELCAGGYAGSSSVVPLGVDLGLFSPRDRLVSRQTVLEHEHTKLIVDLGTTEAGLVSENSFIVGTVGRLQPRKRIDLTIEYFAEWVHRHNVEDAYLLIHTAPTGERACDVRSLVRYHGLLGRVILCEPPVGYGEPPSHMPYVYSSLDLYLSTTQGEGWGLPVLEAMACGIPCIVPDWSGLGDWTRVVVSNGRGGEAHENVACLVPCTSTALSAPLNAHPYTIGGVPDRAQTVQALQHLYTNREIRRQFSVRGLRLASVLPWERTGEEFRAVLESVVEAEQARREAEEVERAEQQARVQAEAEETKRAEEPRSVVDSSPRAHTPADPPVAATTTDTEGPAEPAEASHEQEEALLGTVGGSP